MRPLLTLLALLLVACPSGYGGLLIANVTNYNIRNRTGWPRTEKGIAVYGSTEAQRLEIDRRVDALEACLGRTIRRDWLSIYIVRDAVRSPCTGRWLLPYPAPDSLCRSKGLTPTAECPCRWRGAIQNGYWIVIVPSLETLKEQVAKLVTRKTNPWGDPAIAKCLGD